MVFDKKIRNVRTNNRFLSSKEKWSKLLQHGILILFVVLIVGIIFQCYQITVIERESLINNLISQRVGLAETVAGHFKSVEATLPPGFKLQMIESVGKLEDVVYCRLVKPTGEIYITSNKLEWGASVNNPAILTNKTVVIDDTYNGENIKAVVVPVYSGYTLWIGFTLTKIEKAVHETILRAIIITLSIVATATVVYAVLFITNKKLRKTKAYSENIVTSMADALIVVDRKGNINNVNKAALDLLGYREKELIGKPIGKIIAPVAAETGAAADTMFGGIGLEKLMKEGFVKDVEMTYITKDGKKVPMSFSGSVMRDEKGEIAGIVCVAKDLSELKKAKADLEKAYDELKAAQTHLIQSEKFVAVGLLAAGVAHEINNPLSGILTNTVMLIKKIEDKKIDKIEFFAKFPEELKVIKEAALRCEKITKALLTYARKAKVEKVPTNINEVIENTLILARPQLKAQRINVVEKLEQKLPPVVCDPNQLQQVFTNIILNAQDAMPDGGTLTISTSLGSQHPVLKSSGQINVEANYLEITISDTGIGIPKENLSKVFEPFFTTKPPGKGTGLGLPVAYGIIEAHNGAIYLTSEEGKGTTVRITLPITKLKKRQIEDRYGQRKNIDNR